MAALLSTRSWPATARICSSDRFCTMGASRNDRYTTGLVCLSTAACVVERSMTGSSCHTRPTQGTFVAAHRRRVGCATAAARRALPPVALGLACKTAPRRQFCRLRCPATAGSGSAPTLASRSSASPSSLLDTSAAASTYRRASAMPNCEKAKPRGRAELTAMTC